MIARALVAKIAMAGQSSSQAATATGNNAVRPYSHFIELPAGSVSAFGVVFVWKGRPVALGGQVSGVLPQRLHQLGAGAAEPIRQLAQLRRDICALWIPVVAHL
jgi:hypothetical protein